MVNLYRVMGRGEGGEGEGVTQSVHVSMDTASPNPGPLSWWKNKIQTLFKLGGAKYIKLKKN